MLIPLLLRAPLALAAGTVTASFSSPSCGVACSAWAAEATIYQWDQLTFNTTIVAATVIEIVNTEDSTTKTTTVFNKLPGGYTLPPMNSQGTQVATITYSRTGSILTTVLAFPTQFQYWDDGYTWNGILPTKTESDGDTICVSAPSSGSFVPFKSFPQPAVVMPTHTIGIPDPQGILFKPTKYPRGVKIYKSFTDEGALQTCRLPEHPAVAVAGYSARFIIQTSTVTEGGNTKGAPSSAATEPPQPTTPNDSLPSKTSSKSPKPKSSDRSPSSEVSSPPPRASETEAPSTQVPPAIPTRAATPQPTVTVASGSERDASARSSTTATGPSSTESIVLSNGAAAISISAWFWISTLLLVGL
ncbi:MAG: hypothetical protein M1840_006367 [Geoglossum simile]|nr:MAG: hypothetical protein M1840_006367 [Geoglossum simile]